MRIPKNTAIAGGEGRVLSARRNDEGCSVTRIFIPLQGRCPLTGTLSASGGSDFLRNRQFLTLNPSCMRGDSKGFRVQGVQVER